MTPEHLGKYSDEWFLGLYLKYGSVEEAVRRYPDNLPISIANYHRLVNRFGLVKSAGRHVSLPETLHFFRLKAMAPGQPLEQIYRRMPPSFQTSLSTLHRIYQYMEKQSTRRSAAALIISAENNKGEVLLGDEQTANLRYGKKVGDSSIPMSFAKEDESHFQSVLRVLQQEVFVNMAQAGKLSLKDDLTNLLIDKNIEPIFNFDIVDVRVKVFQITLPDSLPHKFSSYKLINHRFENVGIIKKSILRTGVSEMLDIYEKHLYSPYTVEFPEAYVSSINLGLSLLDS